MKATLAINDKNFPRAISIGVGVEISLLVFISDSKLKYVTAF